MYNADSVVYNISMLRRYTERLQIPRILGIFDACADSRYQAQFSRPHLLSLGSRLAKSGTYHKECFAAQMQQHGREEMVVGHYSPCVTCESEIVLHFPYPRRGGSLILP